MANSLYTDISKIAIDRAKSRLGESAKSVNWIIKDVGPKTILTLQKLIATMDIVFWNGTLGIVESPTYKRGSLLLLHALEHCKANVIIGGGDTAGFVNQYPNTLSHISTGGGASIHYLGI